MSGSDIVAENEKLQSEIEAIRGEADELGVRSYARHESIGAVPLNLQLRKLLKGHFGKIYACMWHEGENSPFLVSASQDGKLIIWQAKTTNKLQLTTLRSSWVMTAAYAPSGDFVACGGLDNICSVYKVAPDERDPSLCDLAGHDGYLSSCRFLSDKEIVTGSGDSTCVLWDVETHTAKQTFAGHTSDVMAVATSKDKKLFVSGSCDTTARVWDVRSSDQRKSAATLGGPESDINACAWFPGDFSGSGYIATGSDDSACLAFDTRTMRQINAYKSDSILSGVTSVAFSKTGKFLFAGYDDYNCLAWDTLLAQIQAKLTAPGSQHAHENRVSCCGVSEDGMALATGSWDTFVKVWA